MPLAIFISFGKQHEQHKSVNTAFYGFVCFSCIRIHAIYVRWELHLQWLTPLKVVLHGYHRSLFRFKVKTVKIAFTQIMAIWTPGMTLQDHLKVVL